MYSYFFVQRAIISRIQLVFIIILLGTLLCSIMSKVVYNMDIIWSLSFIKCKMFSVPTFLNEKKLLVLLGQ